MLRIRLRILIYAIDCFASRVARTHGQFVDPYFPLLSSQTRDFFEERGGGRPSEAVEDPEWLRLLRVRVRGLRLSRPRRTTRGGGLGDRPLPRLDPDRRLEPLLRLLYKDLDSDECERDDRLGLRLGLLLLLRRLRRGRLPPRGRRLGGDRDLDRDDMLRLDDDVGDSDRRRGGRGLGDRAGRLRRSRSLAASSLSGKASSRYLGR